ncbi:MAG: FAD-binding protein [Pseudomonadota bacterium]
MSALEWDASYDLVVVGSGGGSMCAALASKALGKQALIIEKQDKVGGSTGYSGGVWWVPNNHVMKRHGVADSYERACQYMDAAVEYQGPGSSPQRREAFLRNGPAMIEFLEQQGMKFVYADGWSDYYDTLPGGEPRGRSLLAELFNIKELGEWAPKLSRYKGISMPVHSSEYSALFLMKRTWAGKKKALELGTRLIYQKISGKELVSNGAAIQGRMLQMALRAQVPLWTDTPVTEFVVENGRVTGVVALREGREVRIKARDGVLINAGGFSHNAAMRQAYQPQPSSVNWTNANPGDTGEIIQAAVALGAALDCMDEAWWVVTSMGPDQSWPEGAIAPDGTPLPFIHHLDLSLPYSMMVDQDGRRFCDEAGAYMEIGQRMYQRQAETGRAVPAWVVMDSRQRKHYPWGPALPGKIPQQWLDSGYLVKADSINELATKTGIDLAGLQDTVTRFNDFCRTGIDLDYGRGSRQFDRCHGDPTIKPNPNLGPIEQAPFYAVRMYPGDVGTAGGVVTDEFARVLKADGSAIPGLYATGNSTAGVTGRCYPGAGASIAASFVFAFIAARYSAGVATI